MSSIPPNIAGAIFQAQVNAAQASRKNDAERNKQAQNARELARMADRHEHEVEDTDQTEHSVVHRDGEEKRRTPQDTFERHDTEEEPPTPEPPNPDSGPPESTEGGHIDVSA